MPHVALEVHGGAARSLEPPVDGDRIERLGSQSALVRVVTAEDRETLFQRRGVDGLVGDDSWVATDGVH